MITLFGCAHFFNFVSFLLYPTDVKRLKCAMLGAYTTLASGARGPRFDPRSLRGKFRCPNRLSLVSFKGMTLHRPSDLDVIWMSPVQGKSALCRLKNPTVV